MLADSDADAEADSDSLVDADSEFETDCDSLIEALTDVLSELDTDCEPETDALLSLIHILILFEISGSTPERLPIGRKSEYTNAKCIGSSIGNWAPLVSSL